MTPPNDLVLTNLSDVPNKNKKIKVKVDEGQGTSADGTVRYGLGPGIRASVRKRKDEAMKAGNLWRAVYDCTASVPETLTFKKDDYMQLLSNDGEWSFVRLVESGAEGYVPTNYIAHENSLEVHEWYHGAMERKDAERLLEHCKVGAFLIRESQTQKGSYSLSLRDINDQGQDYVRHYLIRNMDAGGFYINAKVTFSSLPELVEYYKANAHGINRTLGKPCRKKPQLWDLSPELQDKWEVDRKTVTMTKKLGHGQFGEVWAGKWNNSTPVAVKTLKKGSMTPEAFLGEAQLMKKFHHDNIVRLYCVCTVGEPILIITELLLDSLLHYLREGPGHTLGLRVLIDMAAQIANGMAYLERGNFGETDTDIVVHRDLAARNVLVAENYKVKVADFGLARAINDSEYISRLGAKFPIKWTAPEAANYGTYTIKSDVWSYGIVLVEIVTHGAIPYPGMQNPEVLQQLERGYIHPQPPKCPDSLYAIMKSCWNRRPEQRPTFETLRNIMDDYFVSTEPQYQE